MATLSLNLKSEYFDQIKSGDKTEEYRLCKPFWHKRLEGVAIMMKSSYCAAIRPKETKISGSGFHTGATK